MGKYNYNFEEMMKEFRKAGEGIQPSEEAHGKLLKIPEQADILKKKKRRKQVYALSAAAAVALVLLAVGINVYYGNRSSKPEKMDGEQLASISGTEGTTLTDDAIAANVGESEKSEESGSGNGTVMETENELFAGANIRGWVAYEGALMWNTGNGLPADDFVYLKKAEGEQVYYAEDYAYDVYQIEEQEDSVVIFINGVYVVYSAFAEGMDITFSVDGIEYAIAYMADWQGYGDCILTVQEGLTGEEYTVYECVNPYTGEVIEERYYVDITEVMKTLYQELYPDKWQIIEENTEPYLIKDGVEYYGGSEEYYWIAIPLS